MLLMQSLACYFLTVLMLCVLPVAAHAQDADNPLALQEEINREENKAGGELLDEEHEVVTDVEKALKNEAKKDVDSFNKVFKKEVPSPSPTDSLADIRRDVEQLDEESAALNAAK